jgi:hypothetical protein
MMQIGVIIGLLSNSSFELRWQVDEYARKLDARVGNNLSILLEI